MNCPNFIKFFFRSIMARSNIILPTYKKVMEFEATLKVGTIEKIHDNGDCGCMGYRTDLSETLQMVVSTPALFNLCSFFPSEKQERLFNFLKGIDSDLYGKLDPRKKSLFLRVTGDNFRGAARLPTEQTSFSILNLEKLVNSPYGQFVSTLWRGTESRENLVVHCGEEVRFCRSGNQANYRRSTLIFALLPCSFAV